MNLREDMRWDERINDKAFLKMIKKKEGHLSWRFHLILNRYKWLYYNRKKKNHYSSVHIILNLSKWNKAPKKKDNTTKLTSDENNANKYAIKSDHSIKMLTRLKNNSQLSLKILTMHALIKSFKRSAMSCRSLILKRYLSIPYVRRVIAVRAKGAGAFTRQQSQALLQIYKACY